MDMDEKEIIGRRIREARERKRFTQGKIAADLGISRVSVTNWESGKTKPDLDKFGPLARILDVSPSWLQALSDKESPPPPEPSNAVIIPGKLMPGPKIPLYGAAVGGDDGEFELNGNVLDYVFAPPSLSGITEAYSVKVAGESMWPRYEDNETIFINPRRRPVRGDYVVVQIQREEDGPKLAYIKRLVRWTQNELILEQFNPQKELRFPGHEVVTVHYVLRSGE